MPGSPHFYRVLPRNATPRGEWVDMPESLRPYTAKSSSEPGIGYSRVDFVVIPGTPEMEPWSPLNRRVCLLSPLETREGALRNPPYCGKISFVPEITGLDHRPPVRKSALSNVRQFSRCTFLSRRMREHLIMGFPPVLPCMYIQPATGQISDRVSSPCKYSVVLQVVRTLARKH